MTTLETWRKNALRAFHGNEFTRAMNLAKNVLAQIDTDASMWQLHGLCALQLEQFETAVKSLQRALDLLGNHAEVLNNLGIAKRRAGDIRGAIEAYERSLAITPDVSAVHNNLGDAQVAEGCFEKARLSFTAALEIAPGDSSARFNLANLLRDMGELDASLSHYEILREQTPNDSYLRWNAALAYLAQGNWATGFELYEARFHLTHMAKPPIPAGLPRWRGESLADQTILIVTEQGFGDIFQMLACAHRLKIQGAKIMVQSSPRLHRLLMASPVVDGVVAEGDSCVQADCYEWLMSLAGRLQIETTDTPSTAPWLVAPTGETAKWRELLPKNDKLKVGINYQGSVTFPHDAYRSMALKEWSSLWARRDISFVSIQKGAGEEQLEQVPEGAVLNLGKHLDVAEHAFSQTADCLTELDLLITSDTAVAHLAGALGCRVWVLLSTVVDWRWGISGERCSWYPSMRLFRQTVRGDWSSVMKNVGLALDEFSK